MRCLELVLLVMCLYLVMYLLMLLLSVKVIVCLDIGTRSRTRHTKEEISSEKTALNVGLIVPFSNFLKKPYEKSVGSAVASIKKKKYHWAQTFLFTDSQVHLEMMTISPSPTGGCIHIFIWR